MGIIEALILGAVQGITEFLPVSSSGHLVLLQTIFGIEEPVLLFDTMVHVGTLAAVFAVLWQDIWALLRRPVQPLALFLVIATIPAVIAALFFKDAIEAVFSSASFLGFAFLATSALLVVSELLYGKMMKNGATANPMKWPDALFIGVFQAAAIVPGLSRSGATLSAGLFRGLGREAVVRFSFLLSIPAILGALVLQLKDLGKGADINSANGVAALAAGTAAAALVGFFSIRLMLKIVRERSLIGFSVYTGIVGILVLVDRFATHFFF